MRGGNSSDAYLERECSDLYEDDEDSEATPRYRGKQVFMFSFVFHLVPYEIILVYSVVFFF